MFKLSISMLCFLYGIFYCGSCDETRDVQKVFVGIQKLVENANDVEKETLQSLKHDYFLKFNQIFNLQNKPRAQTKDEFVKQFQEYFEILNKATKEQKKELNEFLEQYFFEKYNMIFDRLNEIAPL